MVGEKQNEKRSVKWLDKLHKSFPKGFLSKLGPPVQWLLDHTSLNRHLKIKLRCYFQTKTTPAWFSELYQGCSVLLGVVFVAVVLSAPIYIKWLALIVAGYRVYETIFFAVWWVFVDREPVHSYKRSLAMWLIGLVEVTLYFPVIQLAFHCFESPSPVNAVYSSVRTLVTIGPIEGYQATKFATCSTLLMGQIVVSYFIVLVVVAVAISAVKPPPNLKQGNVAS